MSLNAAVQSLAMGLAATLSGFIITQDASGCIVGYVALAANLLAMWYVSRIVMHDAHPNLPDVAPKISGNLLSRIADKQGNQAKKGAAMRFTPTILPATATPTTRAVKGLTGIHAVKPAHVEEAEPTAVTLSPETQHGLHRQGLPAEDRRMACRRIHNQKVLIELRSGLDRRRHNLMESGTADHIDEEA